MTKGRIRQNGNEHVILLYENKFRFGIGLMTELEYRFLTNGANFFV